MNEEKAQVSEDVSSEVSDRVAGVTSGGKNVVIHQTNAGPWKIKFKEGGELPHYLKGRYTDYRVAQLAVDKYIRQDAESHSKKESKRVVPDAKRQTKS